MKITSVNNELIKEVVKLQKKKSDKFILEGQKPISEAIDYGVKIEHLFVLETKENLYFDYEGELIILPEHVMKKISTTESVPTGLAVALKRKTDVSELRNSKIVALFEGIKDAGNLGTIIRSAAAFGIKDIVLYGDTVDEYNPKCIRSCAGNFWKVNTYHIKGDFNELKLLFSGFNRIATVPVKFKVDCKVKTESAKTLLMFGSESEGLSEELKGFATNMMSIDMSKGVESLNLGVSAGIIFYKLYSGK